MTKAQHTPGPWFIHGELAMQREGLAPDEIADEMLFDSEHSIFAGEPLECTRGLLRGHKAHICDIDAYSFDFDDDEDVCRSTALANARLIAAAPDLLAVLQELGESASYWSEYDVPIGIVERIRAAIAKATGEP